MKKLNLLFIGILLVLPVFALAQTAGNTGFVPIAPIPGLTEGATTDTQGFAKFLNQLYVFLIGFAAAAAVIEIIIGGIQYATTDNVSKKSDGKARIQQAILGLILVLMPVLVFSIINPKILNLSAGWEAIPSTPANVPGTNGSIGTAPQTQTTTSSGVTQTVTGTYIKTATFTSTNPDNNNQAATDWLTSCSGSLIRRTQQTSTCTGGFTSGGVCVGASAATAQCIFPSPSPYTFVDIQTSTFGNLTFQYILKPTDAQGTAFIDSCAADGGEACVPLSQTFDSLPACPAYSFTIPQGAPNASSGGSCYSAVLTCKPKVNPPATCRSGVVIQK